MKTITLLSLAIALLLSTAFADDYFDQPTPDPAAGEWEVGTPVLPPLNEITARAGQDRPVYGVYLWGGEYARTWQELKKMGVRSVRISGPSYEMNEALRIAAREDMEVMVTLSNNFNTPAWRSKRKLPDFESMDDYLATLRETITVFFAKYGPGGTLYGDDLECPIVAVEILNEPNYQYLIPDRQPREEVENEREAAYAKILPVAYETIQTLPNPLPVVGFSCGGGGATRADYRFVQGVYQLTGNSLSDKYDIFSTHPYTHGAPPEAYKLKNWGPVAVGKNTVGIRKLLGTYGAGAKPIWWTEVGYEITQAAGGKFPTKKARSTMLDSVDLQAAYNIRMYLLAMRVGVGRVHIMHMHDTDGYNGGLVDRATLEWRPAAHAIQNIAAQLPNPRLVGAQADGEDGLYVYEFIADHTAGARMNAIVAWNVAGPTTVDIKLPGNGGRVTVYDMVGNARKAQVRNGKVTLEVGPYPVFIR